MSQTAPKVTKSTFSALVKCKVSVVGLSVSLLLPLVPDQLFASESAQATQALKPLSIDPHRISVSGVSSGAFMAVQLHLAHSKTFSGVGSFAGGIYWCSEGSDQIGRSQCMGSPQQIQVQKHVQKAKELAQAGQIDPLENLKKAKVFLFASAQDWIIRSGGTEKLKSFYEEFLPSTQIKTEMSVPAAHGFPTLNYGNPCALLGSPWLLNCGYDGAGEMLAHLYGPLRERSTAAAEETKGLLRFDQAEFNRSIRDARLFDSGWVFVPHQCEAGSKVKCGLHVALHGCQMNPDFIQDRFAKYSGFNAWAESNDLVILYPQSAKSAGNPYGCWDWFGFTGPEFVTQAGPQIKAIKAMVDRMVN